MEEIRNKVANRFPRAPVSGKQGLSIQWKHGIIRENSLPWIGRHSRVFLAGIQEVELLDARQVRAGMTMRWMQLLFLDSPDK